jgi:enoyl-CoA hydratase/carnithine racemase
VIALESSGGVAWLRLNRPQALNALNRELTSAIETALDEVATREDITVLVVSGRGRAFCAGNDIAEMGSITPAEAEALASRQAVLMDRFSRLSQVTIAAIDGYALGGGLMLAVAQDLRIASDRSRLGLPEVTLGFNPAYGIARLLDVLGGGHGRDLLLTGRTIHASEALKMGLVNRVVAAPTLESSAAAWAAEIARSPRGGLAATKEIIRSLRAGAAGDEARAYGATLRTSPEARARIADFVARRGRRPKNGESAV